MFATAPTGFREEGSACPPPPRAPAWPEFERWPARRRLLQPQGLKSIVPCSRFVVFEETRLVQLSQTALRFPQELCHGGVQFPTMFFVKIGLSFEIAKTKAVQEERL